MPTHVVTLDSLESRIQEYQADPAIFDLSKELATLRVMRDDAVQEYKDSPPNSKLRDSSIYKLSVIINNIINASVRFYNLMRQNQFALTIAQARQLRETLKRILVEESSSLESIVAPINIEIAEQIASWRLRVSDRLQNEFVIETETSRLEQLAAE